MQGPKEVAKETRLFHLCSNNVGISRGQYGWQFLWVGLKSKNNVILMCLSSFLCLCFSFGAVGVGCIVYMNHYCVALTYFQNTIEYIVKVAIILYLLWLTTISWNNANRVETQLCSHASDITHIQYQFLYRFFFYFLPSAFSISLSLCNNARILVTVMWTLCIMMQAGDIHPKYSKWVW